jgi:hypothetical protein
MAESLDPDRVAILWPMVALVGLTLLVSIRMYVVRIGEMRARRISPQSIATSRSAAERLELTGPADNFRNLFELPVLFYALCLALYVTGLAGTAQLALAWTFVLLRVLHSAIHTTYNRVMDRFRVYVLGMLCIFVMWGLFAVQLLR